jgi:acetyltransferase-like isoleucine patch superfamily enzyme
MRYHLTPCASLRRQTRLHTSDFPLLCPPVAIDRDGCICAYAFSGPGVTIGESAIVGAGGGRVEGREAVDECH